MSQTSWSKHSSVNQKHSSLLESHPFILLVHVCEERVRVSRCVSERAPQLLAQVLYVPPLALMKGLSGQVDVIDGQLCLVKQPLDHKQRTCAVWTQDHTPACRLRVLRGDLRCCDSLFNVG